MSGHGDSLLRISQAAVVGIHAMAYLAQRSVTVPAAQIAEQLRVPLDPLHKVLAKLVKRGWLEASRGPTGGYKLLVSPQDITALEAVKLLDEDFGEGACLLPTPSCRGHESCQMKLLHAEIRALLEKRLSQMTIVDAGWAEDIPAAIAGVATKQR